MKQPFNPLPTATTSAFNGTTSNLASDPTRITSDRASYGSDRADLYSDFGIDTKKEDHREGSVTKTIEAQTSKIPSGVFLGFALGSMVVSALLALTKRKEMANFVGLWAPSFLLLGIYNKLVKTVGSDRQTPA